MPDASAVLAVGIAQLLLLLLIPLELALASRGFHGMAASGMEGGGAGRSPPRSASDR